jgi:glycerol kinase
LKGVINTLANYILSFDQGTTSTRAVVFDRSGAAVASDVRGHQQIYPNPGWVSHNPEEIYFNVLETGRRALEAAGIDKTQLAGIGITNQRETLVVWDSRTGEPVCDAIVWQCKRTSDICRRIVADGFESTIRRKTGLVADPYFTATKLKWVLENIPAARSAKGKLLAGTMDSYITWRLTGRHVTDYTNASRTMLFNRHELKWDAEILDYFGIPAELLPRVISSSEAAGVAEAFGAPVAGIAGDQHAALFGQTCFETGDIKNTYGTGCFVLKNIGQTPIITEGGLLTTIAWNIGGKTTYALEGSVFSAGAAIQWLINEMRLVDDVRELNDICNTQPDTEGVYFVPAFTGLGAPRWDMDARGVLCGLSLYSNKKHIVRALMESIAYQSKEVMDYMNAESGAAGGVLRVDGGVSSSDFLMQFQADISGITVERPANIETTALGAAYLAGLATGFWSGLDELKAQRRLGTVFVPGMPAEVCQRKYEGWLKAVQKAT